MCSKYARSPQRLYGLAFHKFIKKIAVERLSPQKYAFILHPQSFVSLRLFAGFFAVDYMRHGFLCCSVQ